MTKESKEFNLLSEINNSLIKIALILSEQDKKRNDFNSKFVDAEINTKESLTSQEHYTVEDLIKSFIREKPELIATAKEFDDDDAPDFPTVDAHDDIIDIEEKMEVAENVVKQPQQKVEVKEEPKVETTVVSEKSSTVEK